MKQNQEGEKQRTTIFWIILSTILFLISSVSFWFYKDIYNQKNFQIHVNTALQTQESRDATALLIIDQAFKNRPVLRTVVSDQAQMALSGILFGSATQGVRDRLIVRIHEVLFSPRPQVIALDLGRIQTFVSNLTLLVETTTGTERESVDIPSSIVLVRAGEVPSLANFGKTILGIGPIALIGSAGIMAWILWKSRDRMYTLIPIGLGLAVGSLILWLITEWYKPIFVGYFQNSYSRIIGEQIITEFLKPLNQQNFILLLLGLAIAGGAFAYRRYAKEKG